MLLSWHLDLAAGASIVLVAVSAFLAVLLLRPSPA
jgi:ABC-type Mn2+/Zn2+ transport system permease subunit